MMFNAMVGMYAALRREARWSLKSANVGSVLPGLIEATGARVVIEIGIYLGFTTTVIASSLAALARKGVLLSADNDTTRCARIENRFAKLPILHHVICADSIAVDWRAELDALEEPYADICVVDGDHGICHARMDIEACLRVLAPDGLVIVHDFHAREWGTIHAVQDAIAAHGLWALYLPGCRARHSYSAAILQRRPGSMCGSTYPSRCVDDDSYYAENPITASFNVECTQG